MLHKDGSYSMCITLTCRKPESAQKISEQPSWGISANLYISFPPLFPTSDPFFLLYQDYSTWWCNIRSKIWLISYTFIFHDVFSIGHFKPSVGGWGSWRIREADSKWAPICSAVSVKNPTCTILPTELRWKNSC